MPNPQVAIAPALLGASGDLCEAVQKKGNKKGHLCRGPVLLSGRGGGIRTRDPLHTMQVRYQAALHPEQRRGVYRDCFKKAIARKKKTLLFLFRRASSFRLSFSFRLLVADQIGGNTGVERTGRMECHNPPLGNRYRLARLQVAAGASNFLTNGKVAETRNLHRITLLKMAGDHFEEFLHEHLGCLSVVAVDLRDSDIGQRGLVERYAVLSFNHLNFSRDGKELSKKNGARDSLGAFHKDESPAAPDRFKRADVRRRRRARQARPSLPIHRLLRNAPLRREH